MHPAFALMGVNESPLELLDYSTTGLTYMDHEHHTLAVLQAQLSQLVNAERLVISNIDEHLQLLAEHLDEHFKQEEQAMAAVDYPYFDLHRRQHKRALEQVALHIGMWKKQRNIWALREFLDGAFARWFVNHIDSPDRLAAEFIADVFHTREARK